MAEEARLESVYTSKAYPEFESRSLRKKNEGVLAARLFYLQICKDAKASLRLVSGNRKTLRQRKGYAVPYFMIPYMISRKKKLRIIRHPMQMLAYLMSCIMSFVFII